MGIKIGFDLGFSDTKIAINKDGNLSWQKETNAIARLGNAVKDEDYDGNERDVVEYQGSLYMVGHSALQYPDAAVQNIMDYDTMKTISPIIAKKYLSGSSMDDYELISFTLSSAFRKYSADYKDFMSEELGIPKEKIRIVPQGAGCKVAVDKIGLDPNNPSFKNFYKNYLIIDIGFNTIDVSCVINGTLRPEDIRGFEHEGVVLVAEKVQEGFKSKFGREISIPRARSLIVEKILKSRENVFDAADIVETAIDSYLDHLKMFLEKFYGDRLDTISNVIFFGGGAEVIRSHKDKWEKLFGKGDFAVIPASDAEYFNALGSCL